MQSQKALSKVQSILSLEAMKTLVCNCAQNEAADKYRRVRLSKGGVKEMLEAQGVREAMLAMGWLQEGDYLVLPTAVKLGWMISSVPPKPAAHAVMRLIPTCSPRNIQPITSIMNG